MDRPNIGNVKHSEAFWGYPSCIERCMESIGMNHEYPLLILNT